MGNGRSIKPTEEEVKYSDYIEEHLSNIRNVWEDLSKSNSFNSLNITDNEKNKLMENLSNHDRSKYSTEEFEPYRKNFFPSKLEDENPEVNGFEKAWNHHQKSNPHHWQYWLMWKDGETTALEMQKEYLIEMLIDWTAMSYKFKDTPKNFYDKNKYTMMFHEQTRSDLEEYLPVFTELAILNNKKGDE